LHQAKFADCRFERLSLVLKIIYAQFELYPEIIASGRIPNSMLIERVDTGEF
jgi:hypothetical protein